MRHWGDLQGGFAGDLPAALQEGFAGDLQEGSRRRSPVDAPFVVGALTPAELPLWARSRARRFRSHLRHRWTSWVVWRTGRRVPNGSVNWNCCRVLHGFDVNQGRNINDAGLRGPGEKPSRVFRAGAAGAAHRKRSSSSNCNWCPTIPHCVKTEAQKSWRRPTVRAFWASIIGLNDAPPQNTPLSCLTWQCHLQHTSKMRFKHGFACQRPVELSPQVQPMIPTPGHATWPSGHATEALPHL